MSISRRALLVHAAVAPYLVLTFALTFAAQTAAAAESGSDESPSSKILRFPNDHSIGTIKFHVHGKKLSPQPARGTIRVPRQATVSLSINYESTRDLSPLGSLAPNSLRTLTMSKLEIKDEQLKYIAHLTGLRMLNLQETDITNDGLDFLKNLKAL